MKKLIQTTTLLLLFIAVSTSCATVKKLPATVAGASRARFVGKWAITKVSYDGLLPGTVQNIFDQAPLPILSAAAGTSLTAVTVFIRLPTAYRKPYFGRTIRMPIYFNLKSFTREIVPVKYRMVIS